MDLLFWAPVIAGGLIAGASSGLLGVFIVGMRIPFLGICIAHAALAGAVFGSLAGLQGTYLLIPALAGAAVTALALGLWNSHHFQMDDNVVMGVLFSASMGLAFLGIGLFGTMGRSDNDVRSLLWGSLNYCHWNDVGLMLGAAVALAGFITLFFKEMRAIMFSREMAAATGIHATLVWTLFLILTAVVLTVNFQTVGGLMIYSLVANPAAAAFQLTKGCRRTIGVAVILGALSGVGGFLISAFTDLPTGAVIVLFSSALVPLAAISASILRRFRL